MIRNLKKKWDNKIRKKLYVESVWNHTLHFHVWSIKSANKGALFLTMNMLELYCNIQEGIEMWIFITWLTTETVYAHFKDNIQNITLYF